jgi:hypothetical protein
MNAESLTARMIREARRAAEITRVDDMPKISRTVVEPGSVGPALAVCGSMLAYLILILFCAA